MGLTPLSAMLYLPSSLSFRSLPSCTGSIKYLSVLQHVGSAGLRQRFLSENAFFRSFWPSPDSSCRFPRIRLRLWGKFGVGKTEMSNAERGGKTLPHSCGKFLVVTG